MYSSLETENISNSTPLRKSYHAMPEFECKVSGEITMKTNRRYNGGNFAKKKKGKNQREHKLGQ